MDPNRDGVRYEFIDAAKRMNPADAVILRYLHQEKIAVIRRGLERNPENQTTGIHNISLGIRLRDNEVEVSVRHLKDLSFLDPMPGDPNSGWAVNVTSREFMRACYPKIPRSEIPTRLRR
jgi:hypothetical protein